MRSWVPFHPLEKLWGGWNVIWIIITRIAIHSNKDKLTVLGKYNSLFCRYFLIQPVSSPLNVVRRLQYDRPLVQTSPTTHVLHKKMQNEVSRWTTFTTTPFPNYNIQIFMTTISPLMISHNNFTINIEVQQFHHLYCSTRMCHYFISLLPFAWKQQWLIMNCAANCSFWFHLYSIFLLDVA